MRTPRARRCFTRSATAGRPLRTRWVRSPSPHTLSGSLEEPAQALWVEQELERRLRLEDAPVAGALPQARQAG